MVERVMFLYPPESEDHEWWPELVDATVETTHGPETATDLWLRFRESPYGIHMESQPYRYAVHFGYDRNQMLHDMGLDVDPNGHQVATATYIGWVLAAEFEKHGAYPVTQSEIGILRLTGLIHDIGEVTHPEIAEEVGAVVGDIPAGQKTDEQRAIETSVRWALYARLFPDMPRTTLEVMEGVITHTDRSHLHEVYELAHDALTLDTALRAGEVAKQRSIGVLPRERAEALLLRELHDIVTTATRPRIATLAGRYALAQEYGLK